MLKFVPFKTYESTVQLFGEPYSRERLLLIRPEFIGFSPFTIAQKVISPEK
jgi:hypothetical protein